MGLGYRRGAICAGALSLALVLLSGCGASNSDIEPPTSNHREAAIRTYLVDKFLYASWYPSVGAIDVRRRVAVVETTLGAGERGAAGDACSAVLQSHQVRKVVIRFGPGKAYVCL